MSRAEDIFEKLVYFGEDAIDEFIMNRQSEELFMDFKQAASDGKSMRALHQNDRRNLGKAISAFGNSEGGVLVWGVECAKDLELGDVAKAKVKVQNVHRFLSWLENAISGCTIPSHNKVRNHIISCDQDGNGFLATYIPKSDIAPLMTTQGSQIYIRSGSNNAVAKEVYLSCNTLCAGGEKTKVYFSYDTQLENLSSAHNSINLITPLEMRVPPRALFSCAKAAIRFAGDISEDFLMDGVIGADGATPKSFRIYVSKNDLRSFVAQALRKNADLAVLANEFFSQYLKTE